MTIGDLIRDPLAMAGLAKLTGVDQATADAAVEASTRLAAERHTQDLIDAGYPVDYPYTPFPCHICEQDVLETDETVVIMAEDGPGDFFYPTIHAACCQPQWHHYTDEELADMSRQL